MNTETKAPMLSSRTGMIAETRAGSKWFWCAVYCKTKGWSPRNHEFWTKAEEAYEEHIKQGEQTK